MNKTEEVRVIKLVETRSRETGQPWNGWTNAGNAVIDVTNSVVTVGSYPDYKSRIASYRSATTLLQGVKHLIQLQNSDSASVVRHVTGLEFITGEIEARGNFTYIGQNVPDPSNFMIQSVKNQTISQLINQIRQANTTLKGLVTLGELGESVRMVNSAGREIFRGLESYRRDINHFAETLTPRRLLAAVGRRWLEYSFGWKPLINDIDDGISALRKIKEKGPPRVLVRASNESVEKEEPTVDFQTLADHEIRIVNSLNFRYGCRLYGCVSTSLPDERVPHQFGIKLDEFIPTVWELIPYSFLVDYFVNIGAIIDAYALNKSGIQWLNIGELRVAEMLLEASATLKPLDGWTYTSHAVRLGAPFKYRRESKTRMPFDPGNLVPSLEFSIPGSQTRWLNTAALASRFLDTSRKIHARM